MGLGCGAKCAKYTLFVFNIIFFLLGGACLGVGIWVLLDSNSDVAVITSSFDGKLKTGAYLLIAGGGAVYIIGFLGCCGAVKEWRPLLVLYAILIGITFIIEITGGVLAVVFNGEVQTEMKTQMTNTIQSQYDDNVNTSISHAWMHVMVELQCCGVTNGSDFDNTSAWDHTVTFGVGMSYNVTYPLECCKMKDSGITKYKNHQSVSLTSDFVDSANCAFNPSTNNSNIDIGCYNKVKDLVMSHSTIVLGIGIGIAVVQLLGIIFACCLCHSITKNLNKVV